VLLDSFSSHARVVLVQKQVSRRRNTGDREGNQVGCGA
jgi:hypothetical protein